MNESKAAATEVGTPPPHPYSGYGFGEVIRLPGHELERVMANGATPRAGHLSGWEFRGYNTPRYTRWLGFQKFIKGFATDDGGQLYGYNVFAGDARSGPDAPWRAKGGGGAADRHGFYDVVPVTPGSRYDDFPAAVLLDYGSGRNHRLNPEGRIRDFLVQVDPANPDLYLGKAYVDLGLFRVFVSYFVLDRMGPAPTA